jgi:hypothetical protein
LATQKKNKKVKFCETIIPMDWPKFTGPAYKDGMSVSKANQLWGEFKQEMKNVGPTPRIYKKK